MRRPLDQVLDYNTTYGSALLRMLARKAAERCQWGHGDYEAITSVILGHAAFESFVNEVAQIVQTELARIDKGISKAPAGMDVDTLGLVLEVATRHQVPVQERYDIAWRVLTGERPDMGAGHRQSLNVLTKLRNDLVHLKSGQTEIYIDQTEAPAGFEGFWGGIVKERHKHPGYLEHLNNLGVLAPGDEDSDWLHRICTRHVAVWACETVEQLAHQLTQKFPLDSEILKKLERYTLGGCVVREQDPARFGLPLQEEP